MTAMVDDANRVFELEFQPTIGNARDVKSDTLLQILFCFGKTNRQERVLLRQNESSKKCFVAAKHVNN